MTHPAGPYNGPHYTRRHLVDTRTWTGALGDALEAWLGNTPHHLDGPDLLIDTGDAEFACCRPGWILVRHQDGQIIVHSPTAAARALEPAPETKP